MLTIKAPKIQRAQAKHRKEKIMLILLYVDGLEETKNPKATITEKLIERNISTMIILYLMSL
jgi:hypothetical protein